MQGIEPIIGHVKHDHRMERNFLSGVIGDRLNTILVATGFNMMKKIKKIKDELFIAIFELYNRNKKQFMWLLKNLLLENYGLFQV